MTKWLLLTFGVLLVVSATWCWHLLLLHPDPQEAWFALQPRVRMPVSQIAGQKSELNFITDEAYSRIRSSWGDPDLVIAAVSVDHHLRYCFDSVAVTVLSGPQLKDLGLSGGIYGYSSAYDSSCHSIGRRFRLKSGETASMQLGITGSALPSDAEVVVMWTWADTKDKLVGVDIDQDLIQVAKWSIIAGLFVIAFSIFLFIRSKHKSPIPVDVHS